MQKVFNNRVNRCTLTWVSLLSLPSLSLSKNPYLQLPSTVEVPLPLWCSEPFISLPVLPPSLHFFHFFHSSNMNFIREMNRLTTHTFIWRERERECVHVHCVSKSCWWKESWIHWTIERREWQKKMQGTEFQKQGKTWETYLRMETMKRRNRERERKKNDLIVFLPKSTSSIKTKGKNSWINGITRVRFWWEGEKERKRERERESEWVKGENWSLSWHWKTDVNNQMFTHNTNNVYS